MAGRQDKPEPLLRKRALVSCDRCKLRRARCIRANPDEACADCTASGVQCESKLPRKQRVYGSVETLSLRFRALESLVKGLFPEEDFQDTANLFRFAAARNIQMPAPNDLAPAEIFDDKSGGRQLSPHILRPSDSHSSLSPSTDHNPFIETQSLQQVEKLVPTAHGVPHYFGPSSSFKLATAIRGLVRKCTAIPEARSLLRQSITVITEFANSHTSAVVEPLHRRMSPSREDEDEATPECNVNTSSRSRGQKRTRADLDTSSQSPPPIKVYKFKDIADLLPSRSVADALIAAYFDQVHMVLPLFHRSMFQCRYEETWERQHVPIQENEETGWLCCLALVFAFGAQALQKHDQDQARELQKKFVAFIRAYFCTLVSTTNLVNVQALVLLQLYDHNVGRRNSSWVLIGTAARIAISMGMHREGPNAEFDPIERNTRRLVWWSLFTFEKVLSMMLGRPSSIDDAEVSVRTPDESMLESRELPPDIFDKALELAKLSYSLRKRACFVEHSSEECIPSLTVAKVLLRELDDWEASLPPHLRIDFPVPPKQKRAIILLYLFYYYIRSFVTRPWLLQKVERNICRLESRPFTFTEDTEQVLSMAEECIASSHKSLQCLNTIASMGFLNGVSWIDVFYVFHGVLIVCADFLARPKEHYDSPEDTLRRTAVCTVLQSTADIKLAPTYSVLSQIATQFAAITGVNEETYTPHQTSEQLSKLILPLQNPAPLQVSILETSNQATNWYENEAANMVPLDFFALYTSNEFWNMNDPHSGYSGSFVEPGGSMVDDWTARTMINMHGI